MLWRKYPNYLDELTLSALSENLQGDSQSSIPFLVWILENPASPLCLPGNIDLFGHDIIHHLLKKGFTPSQEAYVVGFTMGNDIDTNRIHLWIFKIATYFLYPSKYKLNQSQLKTFDLGVRHGRAAQVKNLNKFDWNKSSFKLLKDIRSELELG